MSLGLDFNLPGWAIGIFLLFGGLASITWSIKRFIHFNKLKKTGIRVQGIIFELTGGDSEGNSYPVMRFLTQKDEWITGKPKNNIATSFQKQGDKVSIIYDPSDPNNFVCDSPANLVIFISFVIGGLGMLGGGIANLLKD